MERICRKRMRFSDPRYGDKWKILDIINDLQKNFFKNIEKPQKNALQKKYKVVL